MEKSELNKLSIEELIELEKKARKLISAKKRSQKSKLISQMKRLAKQNGYAIEELFGDRVKKGKKQDEE